MKKPKRGSETSQAVTTKRATVTASPSESRGWLKQLRDFRLLAIILGASCALGAYEALREDLPPTAAEVDPNWLLGEQHNLVKTLLELYPERSHGHFLQSYQAAMCWENQFQPTVCRAFPHQDLRDVQAALEAALQRAGDFDQEKLFHFYAFILDRLNEPPEVVDEAVRNWRRHYPYSTLPDPRQPRLR